jgi:pyridoxal phosphate enzyme (YggS family)
MAYGETCESKTMSIIARVREIEQLIRTTEIASHRIPGEVFLLAVSKGRSILDIKQAYHAGLMDFAESYVQEAKIKQQVLAELPLSWHFIGPIQGNKTKYISHHFTWVHSVCRHTIAQQLNDARPVDLPPQNICIQVNLDNEDTKSGIHPNLLPELAHYILQLPKLRLRGLMAIPKQQQSEQDQLTSFMRLTSQLHVLNQQLNISMDTLSMGMSHDMTAAVRAGTTIVRIGTALFGKKE